MTNANRQREDGTFALHYDEPFSIGYKSPFYGNFLVLLRACSYILLLGLNGLIEAGEHAVLNANYLLASLKDLYKPGAAYPLGCMHEFVVSPIKQMEHNVHAIDIAKALRDIAELAENNSEAFAEIPVTTPVTSLDEIKAARDMDIVNLG
ncbi:MAG: hypothetical protein E4H36_15225 [Spirochaetales bacterium]|nr:MAG: hypothetical protein E4H36_15225 [Spirochaetales bacterium]